jgi:hypothetical protein
VEKTDTALKTDGLGYIPHHIIWAGPLIYNGIQTAHGGPTDEKRILPSMWMGQGIFLAASFGLAHSDIMAYRQPVCQWEKKWIPPSMQMGQDIFLTALCGLAHSDIFA